jgi:hypothetical protein
MIMRRRIAIGCVTLLVAACALNDRPTLSPEKMAAFWVDPIDLSRRNLLYGRGGATLAPAAQARFLVEDVDKSGFSPGYDVKDDRGRAWNVKLGPEARTEVVVSRILWAMGYHQPAVYYLPRWTAVDQGRTRTEGPARFRLEPASEEEIGDWSWRDNPFLDTRPFAGLFVLMVIVNNWDLKSAQNAVYRVKDDSGVVGEQYVIKDLGASLGRTNWWLPGTRDDIEAFTKEPFIDGISGNRVRFHFKGAWREPQLINSVTADDVRWICERLARLSRQQWRDAFRAGGYTDAEAEPFIRRLLEKIGEGRELVPPGRADAAGSIAAVAP